MQVKTRVKAGYGSTQHNEMLVWATKPATGLKVKTKIKAGSRQAGEKPIE